MKKIDKLSIYSKLLLLIFVSSVAFILLFLYLFYYTLKQEDEVYTMTQKQLNDEVNSLMKLNSESHISTIVDISYWDELVKYIRTKNQKWFDDAVGSAIHMYFVEYLGVYDLNGNKIGEKYTSEIKHPINFLSKRLLEEVYRKKLVTFYTWLPEGYAEVFIATIHPSNDPTKAKTKPEGFFVMVRLLDSEYIERLEQISTAEVSFTNSESDKLLFDDYIKGVHVLKSWDGKKVTVIAFKRKFFVNFNDTEKILTIIMISFILFLIIYILFLQRWVSRPLSLTTQILETGSKKALKKLKSSPGEFSKIGVLFEEAFSQRKQLEKAKRKAEESDQLKTAFLTNLSHEIRTPMNAIIGFSELLKESDIDEEEKLNYIKIINKSGTNLVSIIDDLIEMSKIDANQVKPNISSVNLESCMNELYRSIAITISKEKEVEFRLVESNNPITSRILIDEIKLKQVLINLITNAIKFTHKGFVEFGYNKSTDGSLIHFFVKDSGLGIDEDDQPFIFDRFRRVDSDYSIKVGGLGLGLAISKAYVHLLGGNIELESKMNVGSNFKFTIPLVIDTDTSRKFRINEEGKEITSGKTATVLVAEDDNINFLLIEKLLKMRRYNVIRARDGLEAIEFCKQNNDINLVLMDIKMPGLSGYDAFAKVKEINPKMPIIAQTAFSSTEEIERIKSFGFDAYITKPLDKEKLYDLLTSILN
ncbi:MAG TPA: response regulator [Flavobacterium sp.]|nr:response regulator [Flavobacterium sp.]